MRNRPDPKSPQTKARLAALKATGLKAMKVRAKAGEKRAIAFLEDRDAKAEESAKLVAAGRARRARTAEEG